MACVKDDEPIGQPLIGVAKTECTEAISPAFHGHFSAEIEGNEFTAIGFARGVSVSRAHVVGHNFGGRSLPRRRS